MRLTRQATADGVIKAGFFIQIMLLALVDVGTLYALAEQPSGWPHLFGLLAVNAVLLPIAAVVWRWLRLQARSEPPS